MRLLFFGMRGIFSLPPLEALLQSQHSIAAVIVPVQSVPGQSSRQEPFRILAPDATPGSGSDLDLPLLPSYVEQSVVQRAWEHDLPVYEIGDLRSAAFAQWMRALSPDVVCVACFNRIVPADLLAIPRHGFLNLHPSLLPQYRGPEPLFWQFRDGVNPVGVTVHWMDAGLDTGDIAAQTEVPLPDGIDGISAERRCAAAGAELLVSVLAALEEGAARWHPQQGEGTAQPSPRVEDFSLSLDWHARRAFNFMRGTQHWGIPYRLQVAGSELLLAEALGWQPEGAETGAVKRMADRIHIGFARGVLTARV